LGPEEWPLVGEVDDSLFAHVPKIKDKKFGSTKNIPSVLQIQVSPDSKEPAKVGSLVYNQFFTKYPPFLFNVVFNTGNSTVGQPGTYADPESIWFNNFLGYYEIDCPKSKWDRPFGYDSDGKVVIEDILRIGKADWNFFSNYLYGVPEEESSKYSDIEETKNQSVVTRVKIGKKHWDLIEIKNVEVVSGYVTNKSLLQTHEKIYTPLWQYAFGEPCPREGFTKEFPPQRMSAKFYMSYSSDHIYKLKEDGYKTVMFGGSINEGFPNAKENAAFMEAQMATVEEIITKYYGNLGFK